MCQLLKAEAKQPDAKLPQVVGLTATPTWKNTPEENLRALEQLADNQGGAKIVQVEDELHHSRDTTTGGITTPNPDTSPDPDSNPKPDPDPIPNLQVEDELESLKEHVHAPDEQRHSLQQRDDDRDYALALPRVAAQLEEMLHVLASEDFGCSAGVAAAMQQTANALEHERSTSSTAGYSKHYASLVREAQGSEEIRSSFLARVALRLLFACNEAHLTSAEVGFESAQVGVRVRVRVGSGSGSD